MKQREISAAVIRRLPRYYRYLGELLQNDVVRISSKELSNRMRVTASQIREVLDSRVMVIMSNTFTVRSARFLDWTFSII